jgi:NADPH-dependent ferric siderophore reductase
VGQTIKLSGPLGRSRLEGRHRRYLLAGDTTALPAIREWLAAIGSEAAVAVQVWAPDVGEHQDLEFSGELTVDWSYGGAPTMADLAEAGRLGPDGWNPQDPDTKFFLAGEASEITRVRRALTQAGPVPPGNLQATPYWRRGQSGADPASR